MIFFFFSLLVFQFLSIFKKKKSSWLFLGGLSARDICAAMGLDSQLRYLLAVILAMILSFESLSFLVCIRKIVLCLLPGVMMRLHSDVAQRAQCLAHCEFSVLAAVVAMNLQSLNNGAANCAVLK